MRRDMAKVVIERPRGGSHLPSLKTAKRLSKDEVNAEDHGATRLRSSPVAQYGYDAKPSELHSSPLRRFLQKRIGRPWNKIYSELSEVDERSISGQRVLNHIECEVEFHCEEIDKKIYRKNDWMHGLRGKRPVEGFFIHPRTGLLCYAKRIKIQYRTEKEVRESQAVRPFGVYQKNHDYIVVNPTSVLERRKGLWFLLTFEALDPNELIPVVSYYEKIPPYRAVYKKVLRHTTTNVFKKLLSTRSLGRGDKALWRLVKAYKEI